MMYSLRKIHLLLVTLGLAAAVQATYINNKSPADGPALHVRQDETVANPSASIVISVSQTTNAATETTPSPSTPTVVETTTQPAATTTAAAETTPSPSEPAASTAAPAETSTTQNAPAQSTTTTQGGNSQQETTAATSQQQTETTPEPTTITSIVIVESTAADGEIHSVTSAATIVSTPTLNAGSNDGDGGGMNPNTRNIVIGVVGGVGGAIVLGALGFVAWRIWGRKRKNEENDGLMDYHTAGTSAFNSEPKPDATSQSTAPSRSPFQTTLEDYHRPGQVNASSNF